MRIATVTSILLLLIASWGTAQETPVRKIGVLVSTSPELYADRDEALRQGLRELGYKEGENITFIHKYADGKLDRLDQLARELVAQKPDVIVVGGTAVAVAAKNATTTIPIVVAGAGDLVEAGLIKSFMYPGGNVTGVARMSADFFGARLKLVKEALPGVTQIAVLWNPSNPGQSRTVKDAELGTQAMGLSFQSVAVKKPADLDNAIASVAKRGGNALFPLTDVMFNNNVARIAQLAMKNKLPAIYDRPDFVDAGGLMSYGVNLPELSRRAAEYVDQIFKGAKPGDLTLVQSMKFDLAINLKTAKQIGVAIPDVVVSRAVKVIK